MVGWHHRLNGHEFEQAQGDGEGEGSLVCCSLWGRKEPDTTEPYNKMNQLHRHIPALPLELPSRPPPSHPLGHHRAGSSAPSAIEQLPTS